MVGLVGSPGTFPLVEMQQALTAASDVGAKRKQHTNVSLSATTSTALPAGFGLPELRQGEPHSEAHVHAGVAMSKLVKCDPEEEITRTVHVEFALKLGSGEIEICPATPETPRRPHEPLAVSMLSRCPKAPLCQTAPVAAFPAPS